MFHPLNRQVKYLSLSLIALCGLQSTIALATDNVSLQRSTLLQKNVELPSNAINAKVIKVTFPPAFKTPLHTHEGPGPRYIIKGKLKVVDNGSTKTYSAGEVFWETGAEMTVENITQDTAEIVIFEMAPVKP